MISLLRAARPRPCRGPVAVAACAASALLTTVLIAGCAAGPTPTHPELPPGSRPTAGSPVAGLRPAPGLALSSPDIGSGDALPKRAAAVSAGGANVSPSLVWAGPLPKGTRSWAIAMVDTTPPGVGFAHWLVADVPVSVRALAPGSGVAPNTPPGHSVPLPAGSIELLNSAGTPGYTGPAPPSGTHTYRFVVYAMPSATSGLTPGDGKERFFATMSRALGYTTFTATFKR